MKSTDYRAMVTGPKGPDDSLLVLTSAPVIERLSPWVTFTAIGMPAPQGSKRHVGHGVMIESSKKVKPWREAVKWAAYECRAGAAPLDGPLVVRMVFTLPKPKSAPKNRATFPDRKPDISKLIRSTEDAMVDAGLIADDARIVEYVRTAKVFPNEGPDALDVPGVKVMIRRKEEA